MKSRDDPQGLEVPRESKEVSFCKAACIMGLFRGVCTKEGSIVALDLRECVQHQMKLSLR